MNIAKELALLHPHLISSTQRANTIQVVELELADYVMHPHNDTKVSDVSRQTAAKSIIAAGVLVYKKNKANGYIALGMRFSSAILGGLVLTC